MLANKSSNISNSQPYGIYIHMYVNDIRTISDLEIRHKYFNARKVNSYDISILWAVKENIPDGRNCIIITKR